MHEILGAIAVVLLFAAYVFYFRSIFLSQAKPHFFTWFIWTVSVTIIFAAQISDGAGPGAWTTGFSIFFTMIIAVYAFFRGEKNITRGDWISLMMALGTIPLWYLTHEPAYAAVLLTLIDGVAYYPTFRKSFRQPDQEALITYALDSMRHLISFLALSQITLATATYPATIGIVSLAFVIFALWRRHAMRAMISAQQKGGHNV